jgi:nucleotide-binding universal stress UspA family protein
VANPRTAESLAQLAFTLAEASEDTSICVLTVLPQAEKRPRQITERLQAKLNMRRQELLDRILAEARQRNAPLYTKLRFSPDVAQGVLDEVRGNVKLVLMGWPGPLTGRSLAANPVKVVLQKARAHVAVLLDRGLKDVRNVLVPVGGGFHSRLAIRLGYEIARSQGARLTALQCYCEACDTEELEDRLAHLDDIVVDSLGSMPPHMTIRLAYAPDVVRGVLEEARRQRYDLIVVGASEQWVSRMKLFGSITDHIAEETECSVLLVRRHEAAAMSWLRRQVKR